MVWAVVAVALLPTVRKRGWLEVPKVSRPAAQVLALMAIPAITLVLGFVGRPRHPDTTTYHLPRVLHWIQNASVAAYPTHIDRQIWIGAGAEYFLVHLRLLTGTDLIVPLVQWLAFVGLVPLVALIARELGATKRGQYFAALFALTLPMAITQSTGGQADVVASFWLCVSIALLLRVMRQGTGRSSWIDAAALGSALGMAALSKAVNVLYLLPFLAWTLATLIADRRLGRLVAMTTLALVPALAVNAGHVQRNIAVWGKPLGIPGSYGVANEIVTPPVVASNVMRNVSLHLNSRLNAWNSMLYAGIVRAHTPLRLDPNDHRTTFGRSSFNVERKIEDEGVSGNGWHLILIAAAGVVAWRKRLRRPAMFVTCVLVAGLIFAAYLKWQPWGSRLHLPLFALCAGLVAATLEKWASHRVLRFTGWVLIAFAFFPLFRNGFVPVISRVPIFLTPPEQRIFHSQSQAHSMPASADIIAGAGCRKVGLVWHPTAPEYPVWYLLRARLGDDVEIRHVMVQNDTRQVASARDHAFYPCALLSIQAREGLPPVIPPGYREAGKYRSLTVWLEDNT